MLVTSFGIVIDVRPEQQLNADCPMFVMLFGIEINVNPEQPLNAESPMLDTPSGIVNEKFVAEENSCPQRGSDLTVIGPKQRENAS